MAAVILVLAGLIPTGLVSRIILGMSKRWDAGYSRLAFVHVASLTIAGLVASYGMDTTVARGAAMYAPSQAIWLLYDVWRRNSGRSEARPGARPPS
jgi:hypothetical protein